MEKKLYRVKVTLYVMGENESDACIAATNAKFDIFECSAKKADHLDPGWEDAIPYNSDDLRTCGEILQGQGQGNMLILPSHVLAKVHGVPAS